MVETYQRTFWKNEHEIEVPLPLEKWPIRADYLTLDKEGSMIFWSEKPNHCDIAGWDGKAKTVVESEDTNTVGGERHIWERPFY